MTLLPPICTIALKEWAVAVNAMAQGKQILILRKGGIHREDKEFRVMHSELFLFPTYEHQREDLIKEEYHRDLAQTIEEDDIPGLVTLEYWSTVSEVFEIGDQETLDSLSPFHIWTSDYAQKRLHWRPKYPLTVALLRLYRLVQPQALPILDEYAGCKSWVDLGQEVPLGFMEPVLPDDEYREKADAIRHALTGAASSATSVSI